MKRLLIIVTILSLTAIVAQAQTKPKAAQPANSPMQTGSEAGKMNSEQIQKFMDATVQLRQDLFGKNAEYQALMRQPSPDPKAAGALARDIFDLRTKIAAEAAKQGLPPMRMMHMGMMGMGMMGMDEPGMGGCGMMGGGMMGGMDKMGGMKMEGKSMPPAAK
ncbi:MAG: hypothetical protein HQK81_06685 [Desulfovibrionaceae bacterium]|nr:hypothetical protein [Desulfovibrionaceae bacterium]MBF0513736.1 hypothetical protein [Desulfovibrionaceae bacterium]